MIVNEATKIRVVRAILGMSSGDFAGRLGISAGTLTAWEKGRNSPQEAKKQVLAELCEQNGIAFSISGSVTFKETQ